MGALRTIASGAGIFNPERLADEHAELASMVTRWISDSGRRKVSRTVRLRPAVMETWIWQVYDRREKIRAKSVDLRFTRATWGRGVKDEIKLVRGESVLLFTRAYHEEQ